LRVSQLRLSSGTFLRDVFKFLPDYRVSHPRRHYCSSVDMLCYCGFISENVCFMHKKEHQW
jgi:hypothetical protein